MMKQMMTYLFLLFTAFSFGQAESIKEGNKLYDEGNYEEAINSYGAVISEGHLSADLYYNLGNAHYKNNELGKAIWAYESALKIEPSHEDALFNLEFSNAQTVEKIDTQRHGFGNWLKQLLFVSSINLWAYTSIVSSVLSAALIVFFLITSSRRWKNISLIGSVLFGLIFFIAITVAYLHKSQIVKNDEGVIVTEQVNILMEPNEEAKTSFILSEGAKVSLVSEEKDWVKIELNGNQGWLPKNDIWEI